MFFKKKPHKNFRNQTFQTKVLEAVLAGNVDDPEVFYLAYHRHCHSFYQTQGQARDYGRITWQSLGFRSASLLGPTL